MTKKDYELIAKIMRDTKPDDEITLITWQHAVELFAQRLKATNVAFNVDRFREACGDLS